MDDRVIASILGGAATLAGGGHLWWILKGRRWLAKCKRRKGGIYLARTLRHSTQIVHWWTRALSRRENGYVGLSNSFRLRWKQHEASQPWSDLDPQWRAVVRLPWWLCWRWILEPLETAAMLWYRPRYNVSKNKWNPRRISTYAAVSQRNQRDIRNHGTAIWTGRTGAARKATR